ncbi:MAG: DUF6489 family protein [SAR86 cluster bacterium]|jgi:hypothetical protein|uniref:Uncharacterized protein n=1 Tax=SAR86 cluster bacterium TaxID=2030880 RepID=A0A972W064_9GAMM|nr:hypothetical protein [SAR86 cluster bacterium]|tara:strand:+ start:315 stop:575 length:261 start_codon:yes stop_codon:yes gene_type:complete
MKITVDVDITPEELRRFIGLPNIDKLQEQILQNAQAYLKESGSSQYSDLIATAMQPMAAYQQWLQKMMGGATEDSSKPKQSGKDHE